MVGIIANPASGKDIRRLVAHATTLDNQTKVGILRCALVGLGAAGVRDVRIMPDSYRLGVRAMEGLSTAEGPLPRVELLDMPILDASDDSEQAAQLLREAGAGCIIVLGGDGTARVVSKACGETPLLLVSTGTNNVVPSFIEGTIAGLAAGALAVGRVGLERVAVRHKWLEVIVNGVPRDRALVDVAAISGTFVGSRAVWSAEQLRQVVVTRADPATIGLSAIAGVLRPTGLEEPRGVAVTLSPGDGGRRIRAAVGPGLLAEVDVASVEDLQVGQNLKLTEHRPLVLALDGEREVVLREQESASVTLCADGPWIVDAPRVLQRLTEQRFFDVQGGG